MIKYVTNSMPTYIYTWLNDNVDPVGSAVIVDKTFTIEGAAADSKKVGEMFIQANNNINNVANNFQLNYGKNRFDESAITFGYINTAGELVKRTDLDWYTSDFIFVEDLDSIIASGLLISQNKRGRIAFNFAYGYDNNKNKIITIPNASYGYTLPDNVSYIRFAYHKDMWNDVQVESGLTTSDYEPYNTTTTVRDADYIRELQYNGDISNINENFVDINENLVDINEKLTAVNTTLVPIYDLIDYTYQIGYYLDSIGRVQQVESATFWLTDPISVTEGDILYITAKAYGTNCLYAFYDNNNNVIYYRNNNNSSDQIVDEKITVPNNAATLRVEMRAAGGAKVKQFNSYRYTKVWYGKTWVAMGDSLTENNRRTTMHYHDYIAENTDINVINMGSSGTGYKKREEINNAFYQRILNIPTTGVDVVTIFGSFNDMSLFSQMGTATDTTSDTIAGCMNLTIDNLYSKIPTVSLGIVSPTPWIGTNPYSGGNGDTYVAILKEICKRRSIPFLDLYHESNLRPWDEEFRQLAYSKDDGNGVHPDETGHALIAPRFKAFLQTLLL